MLGCLARVNTAPVTVLVFCTNNSTYLTTHQWAHTSKPVLPTDNLYRPVYMYRSTCSLACELSWSRGTRHSFNTSSPLQFLGVLRCHSVPLCISESGSIVEHSVIKENIDFPKSKACEKLVKILKENVKKM